MSDAELIAAARERCLASPQGRLISALADRLEQLAKSRPLPEGTPLAPGALADVREEVALGLQDRSSARGVLKLMLRDLLAGYDHALAAYDRLECCLADVARDQGYRLARADGVAAALAAAGRVHADFCRRRDLEYQYGGHLHATESAHADAAEAVLGRVRIECGPAELPPHAASLALLRKRTAALRQIVELPSPALAPMQTGHAAKQIADDALEEEQ